MKTLHLLNFSISIHEGNFIDHQRMAYPKCSSRKLIGDIRVDRVIVSVIVANVLVIS